MKQYTLFFVISAICCLYGCSDNKKLISPKTAQSEQFAVGDVWTYKTRPGEEASRLIIGKVENIEKIGMVIHIKLLDIKIKNADAPNGLSTEMIHAPITEAALKKSVIKKVAKDGNLDDFNEGYETWLASYQQGDAGAFCIPVSEIVGCMEKAVNQ